jgi:hypothetical protein
MLNQNILCHCNTLPNLVKPLKVCCVATVATTEVFTIDYFATIKV